MAAVRKQTRKVVEKLDPEIQKTDIMLRALEDFQDKLSDWERGFVESLEDWFYARGRKLTERQYETLKRVYDKFY